MWLKMIPLSSTHPSVQHTETTPFPSPKYVNSTQKRQFNTKATLPHKCVFWLYSLLGFFGGGTETFVLNWHICVERTLLRETDAFVVLNWRICVELRECMELRCTRKYLKRTTFWSKNKKFSDSKHSSKPPPLQPICLRRNWTKFHQKLVQIKKGFLKWIK